MTLDQTEIAAVEITGAIPRLTEATISNLAEHLHASEASIAVTVRTLLDEDVIAQGAPAPTGDATYVTVGGEVV
ncbi:hypothetical protein [Kineococcus rhizosphaerae]|uniref:MarR family protein n=1 Tax=Kineococcus rhizosphaerae TaxID=559628 RepID=A0A2T0RAI3_9ACTN|nr:hypothetical protein [Kineococcus rhizosphaerae]PRY18176.1 hypothetical protein CLV37_101420 [Kineococcus rhizosphaerae]